MGEFTLSLGLKTLHERLYPLEKNPRLLELERSRFDRPPPPFKPTPSGTPTVIDDPSHGEESRIDPTYQVSTRATRPSEQFRTQEREEMHRLWKADPTTRFFEVMPGGYEELAHNNVKEDWRSQGIWNDSWNPNVIWRWMHEEPPEAPSTSPGLLDQDFNESSRPLPRFLHQMSRDREEIIAESNISPRDPSLNSMAYERRRNKWLEQRIWDERWGILPGAFWAHEYLGKEHEAPVRETGRAVQEPETATKETKPAGRATPVDSYSSPHVFGSATPEDKASTPSSANRPSRAPKRPPPNSPSADRPRRSARIRAR